VKELNFHIYVHSIVLAKDICHIAGKGVNRFTECQLANNMVNSVIREVANTNRFLQAST
jgi:hypothetical protein